MCDNFLGIEEGHCKANLYEDKHGLSGGPIANGTPFHLWENSASALIRSYFYFNNNSKGASKLRLQVSPLPSKIPSGAGCPPFSQTGTREEEITRESQVRDFQDSAIVLLYRSLDVFELLVRLLVTNESGISFLPEFHKSIVWLT